ncbi:MAG: hypothetical protein C0475_06795 [Planctomyces sp.]|nr:hypothetical protein [Planctomyces sp.]MBA4039357.1 hypothetical protein [Planctomyces sp.]
MLLTMRISALAPRLAAGSGPGRIALLDVPALAKGELGVNGLIVGAEQLAGADRPQLNRLSEAADKAGCPCLVLTEPTPQPFADDDPEPIERAEDRCMRLAQAAQWLSCSAFAFPVVAGDSAEQLDAAAANLKKISRRAERLDLNMCLMPHRGLTAHPDGLTALLKKIGGFRVGTLPDLADAVASGDPVAYLRRLVPYASAVFVPGLEELAESRRRGATAGVGGSAAAAPPKPAGVKAARVSKGSRAKKAAPGTAQDTIAPPAESAAGPLGAHSLDDLAAQAAAGTPIGAEGVAVPQDPAELVVFLAGVLETIGYEHPVALDHRGKGDPIAAMRATRDLLARLHTKPEADPLAAAISGEEDPLEDAAEEDA